MIPAPTQLGNSMGKPGLPTSTKQDNLGIASDPGVPAQ